MKDKEILAKINKYCCMLDETLAEYDNSYEKFESSHIFQNSSCMCLLQIGELCKYLSKDFVTNHIEVDWKGWCGLRDVFAHQYGRLDIEEIWKTIKEDYPILKENIMKLIN